MGPKGIARGTGKLRALILVPLLAMAGVSALPHAAFAGSNGQQVYFELGSRCGGPTLVSGGGLDQYVTVVGHNQNGQSVTWRGSVQVGSYIKTTGWWWVGNITIHYHQSGVWKYVNAYVPQANETSYQFWPSVVRVDCHGSWQYGTAKVQSGTGYNVFVCGSSSNPTGHYTQYTTYAGYWGIGWNGLLSPNGYKSAYGKSVPWLIMTQYNSIVCG